MKDLVSGVGLLNFFDYNISMTLFDELFYMDIHPPGLSFGDGEFGFNVYYGINDACCLQFRVQMCVQTLDQPIYLPFLLLKESMVY